MSKECIHFLGHSVLASIAMMNILHKGGECRTLKTPMQLYKNMSE